MTMTKREIAIASVTSTLLHNIAPEKLGIAPKMIIDQLIADGIISLGYAGDPDVSELVDHFQIAIPSTATIKTDRYAAARLAKRYGRATVLFIIQGLGKRRGEKFAPVVNNLTQLEQKWPQVERFVSSPARGDGLDV